jgi:hypothetical protein
MTFFYWIITQRLLSKNHIYTFDSSKIKSRLDKLISTIEQANKGIFQILFMFLNTKIVMIVNKLESVLHVFIIVMMNCFIHLFHTI